MTILKPILFFSMIALFFSISAFAQTDEAIVATRGKIDCGEWIDYRSSVHSEIFEYHILGFINGYAVGTKLNIWTSGENAINDKQAYLWLDKYCRENPLSNPYVGVNELFLEIFSKP